MGHIWPTTSKKNTKNITWNYMPCKLFIYCLSYFILWTYFKWTHQISGVNTPLNLVKDIAVFFSPSLTILSFCIGVACSDFKKERPRNVARGSKEVVHHWLTLTASTSCRVDTWQLYATTQLSTTHTNSHTSRRLNSVTETHQMAGRNNESNI